MTVLTREKMMTEKQKKIYVGIGVAGVVWLAMIILVVAHIVSAGDDFTLKDLENLRKQVENQAEGAEECVPDCLMQQSEIEKKLDMSNKGRCFDKCLISAGSEVCYEIECRYEKKIGRKMYSITVHYSTSGEVSGAESISWEEIDD